MIVLSGVYKNLPLKEKKNLVLKDINLTIKPGEIISLVGPNGCGKTTLLKIMAGLDRPSEGTVTFPTKTSGNRTAVGMVFRNVYHSLFPWHTVRKHLCLPLRYSSVPLKEKKQRISEMLNELHLNDHASKYPYQLSGGLAQLTAIGRALVAKPSILLLDEPFSTLDYYTSLEIQTRLIRLLEKTNISAVLVTHSLEEAILISDRIVVLSNAPGRIIKESEINLPRPRRLEQLTTTLFTEYKRKLLETMRGFLCTK